MVFVPVPNAAKSTMEWWMAQSARRFMFSERGGATQNKKCGDHHRGRRAAFQLELILLIIMHIFVYAPCV